MASDPYDVLGVGRDASAEEIRRAYRSRAREEHPDVSARAGAEDRFKALAEAYDDALARVPLRPAGSSRPQFIDEPAAGGWSVVIVHLRWS